MMDGYANDDYFTLPLVLDSSDIQSMSLVNSNTWQLEVSKDQSVPLVILDNGGLSLQTDCPLILPNAGLLAEEIVSTTEDNYDLTYDKSLETENISDKNEISTDDLSDSPVLIEDLVETVVIYKCKLCSFKSSDSTSLSNHLKSQHLKNLEKRGNLVKKDNEEKEEISEKLAYMCGKCSEAFGSFADWRSHMASIHKIVMSVKAILENSTLNGGLPLELKSNKSKSEPLREEGRRKFAVPRKQKTVGCPIQSCLVRLSSRDLVEKHKECHAGPRNFACPHCSTPFRKWCDCANHLWTSHAQDIDLYSCPNCDYKTALRVKLDIHIKIHGEEREFPCIDCGKRFKQAVQLKNHRVSHLKAADSPDIPNWSKKQECPQCKRMFYDSKSLKKHIQSVHSKLRPYVCQVCGHKSANKNRMGLHLRQHTGEKPFSCPMCNFTTGDQNCLRRHAWRHSRVRPYSCPHCSYSCIQSNSLKIHIKTQHPGASGVYSCERCTFTTLSQTFLDSHIVKCHGDKNEEINFTQIVYIGDMENGKTVGGHGQLIQTPVDITMRDDESQNCFEVPVIDTGGITIPADQESQ